ncbi:hypothetical protein FPZ12_011370 [Amycolatopsis acidicola]|uniref:Uncharacterized protein n=1 Tax=Amycolatopsis acidicola TaxID=2596893 RepID=A0A5N0V8B8_9PSEU|nr:hypothetical protein [Amycolatopsis acidicola]KAA9162646.1 hypothetical protein FPZ12_011370 [Amycolatopsis acidicola]
MGANEVDTTWVAALSRHLNEKRYADRDNWDLGKQLLQGQPDWVDAARAVFDRREQAQGIMTELRQFTISVALHSLDTTILGMPAIGSGEYAEGYLRGLRACRIELSHHLRRPPAPRPDALDLLDRLRSPMPPPPAIPVVRDHMHDVLERARPAWTAEERAAAAWELGRYLVRFATTALKEARRDLTSLHRRGGQLLDALNAPGELHVTESFTSKELADRLRSFAATVRQDATPGRTFAAGFSVASEHVARMSEQRATDPRFPRGS